MPPSCSPPIGLTPRRCSGFKRRASGCSSAWLTELTNLATWLFGTESPWLDGLLETTFVLLVAVPILASTRRLRARVDDLEHFWDLGLGPEAHPAAPTRPGEPITPAETLVAPLGDGDLTRPGSFARGTWVQSSLQPDRVGRVIAGRLFQTPSGARREVYDLALPHGRRVTMEGQDLRRVPTCCRERPMSFLEATREPFGPVILGYRCRVCRRTMELVL